MNKVLFIDTETGGLDPRDSSLLSIGLVAWNDGVIVDERELFILHPIIKFTPGSLSINKIDFLEFINKAIEPANAITQIENFCNKNFEQFPITLGGHNINFDTSFLKNFIGDKYPKYFSHRVIDTSSILTYLRLAGLLDDNYSSSDKAFQYFNISVPKRHSALDDAKATAILFSNLINMLKND